jgi:hypothetical protein
MTISAVRAYFETALNTWATSQSPAIPISFENTPFTKPSSGNFLECFLLPASTLARTVGANKEREVGIFQVNIWTPNGVGTGDVMSVAEDIVSLFPIVPKVGSVSIDKAPSIERAILDTSGWYVLPIIFHYRHENY